MGKGEQIVLKLLLAFVTFVTFVQADIYKAFANALDANNSKLACSIGKKIVFLGEKDEKLLSAIAQVCLKEDWLLTTTVIQSRLRKTKDSRANATILASLELQKKLIYQFMYDNTDISTFYLPVTNHPLSYVFSAIRDGKYKLVSKNPKIISFKCKNLNYKVYIDKNDKGRVIIEITDPDGKKQKRRYF